MPPICASCDKHANFNFIGITPAKFCSVHCLINMVDVNHTVCEIAVCGKQASCGYEDQGIKIRCGGHKCDDMIYLSLKYCDYEFGCRTLASFGYKGDTAPSMCDTHKKSDMVSLMGKRCEGKIDNGESCIKRATFGLKGTRSPIFCKIHMPAEGYENVIENRHCIDCDKRPSFAYLKGDKPTYCEEHCLIGMINIYTKKCLTNKEICEQSPTFGLSSPTHCKKHKEPDMSDMRHPYCIVEKCYKDDSGSKERRRASFNYNGEKLRLYCGEHKKTGMINLERPLCNKLQCIEQAHWGYMFGKRKYCKYHKSSNMYDEDHINPKCVDCPKLTSQTKAARMAIRATYCKDGESYPTKCEKHKPNNGSYVNIAEKQCELCKLVDFIPSNKTLCFTCNAYSKQRNMHSKELRIADVLTAANIPVMSHDKVPEGACSKYRPDFVIDCGRSLIILEVDENQHQSYACECEISRMIQLHNDFGGIPLIFIRYNPDSYKDASGKRIDGGTKNIGREFYLTYLIKRIKLQIKIDSYDILPLSVYHLYYDGFDGKFIRNSIDYFSNTVAEIAEKIF